MTPIGGVSIYKIFRNTVNNSGTASQIGTSTSLFYDDTTTGTGIIYYYWVEANNYYGDSSISSPDTGWRAPSRKNLGAVVANDWPDEYYDDVQNFADTLSNSQGWNQSFISHDPSETWWKEESSSGADNSWADNTELSLIHSHSALGGGNIIYLGFGTGHGTASPFEVKLGYTSPDSTGYNIWNFAIECETLNDNSYNSWYAALNGEHMMLGFKTDAYLTTAATDMQTLANYLTGTGGKAKKNIQNSFFSTFVVRDGIHDNNICRILAEDTSVADNDSIDFFNPQISVDSTKTVITFGPAQ